MTKIMATAPSSKRCFDEIIASLAKSTSSECLLEPWVTAGIVSSKPNDDGDDYCETDGANDDDDDDEDDVSTDGCDSCDVDSDADEEEDLLVKKLVSAAFARRTASSLDIVTQFITSSVAPPPIKRQRRTGAASTNSALLRPSHHQLLKHVVSESVPNLSFCHRNTTAGSCSTKNFGHSPEVVLRELLESRQISFPTFPALSLDTFFIAPSREEYDMDMIQAVRHDNVQRLREIYLTEKAAGRTMQRGNAFGETIVHTACRRGALESLQFLLHEANVTPRVCCDYGRTPLHDACWTADANLAVVQVLLDACPDLLFITDKRGHTALSYIHKENWAEWCTFLQNRGVDKLIANTQLLRL